MIDFSGYTYAEILQQMLARVDNSLDKREGSLIQTAIAPGAWYLEGLMLVLSNVQKAAYVITATGQDLDYLVLNRGIKRIEAKAAVRTGLFNVPLPAGTLFKTLNGENAVQFSSGASIGTQSGYYAYAMTCLTPGDIGNHYTGNIIPVTSFEGSESLTFAQLTTVITPGNDEESDESLRSRFIVSLDAAPYGGNMSEYRQAILAIAGVGGVQIYPANSYNGGGTVLCSIVDTDFAPATATLVKTVQDTICPPESGGNTPSPNGYGIAPIGAAVTIRSATGEEVGVACDVTYSAGADESEVNEGIKDAVKAYLKEAATGWGEPAYDEISYSCVVYASRMIAAVLSVSGVANVSNLTINDASGDLVLTETAALQQIPVFGGVAINGWEI